MMLQDSILASNYGGKNYFESVEALLTSRCLDNVSVNQQQTKNSVKPQAWNLAKKASRRRW